MRTVAADDKTKKELVLRERASKRHPIASFRRRRSDSQVDAGMGGEGETRGGCEHHCDSTPCDSCDGRLSAGTRSLQMRQPVAASF